MNAFQYYVIDSVIKFSGIAPENEEDEDRTDRTPILGSPRESFTYDEEAGAEERLLPKPVPGKTPSQKSLNSSMMLLPGSRGDSTPGYADSGTTVPTGSRWEEDESTLVDR